MRSPESAWIGQEGNCDTNGEGGKGRGKGVARSVFRSYHASAYDTEYPEEHYTEEPAAPAENSEKYVSRKSTESVRCGGNIG